MKKTEEDFDKVPIEDLTLQQVTGRLAFIDREIRQRQAETDALYSVRAKLLHRRDQINEEKQLDLFDK